MTPLRQRLLHDLQRRNYSPGTIDCYVRAVARFAAHFGRSPDQLGGEHVRLYQLHLLEQKTSWCRFNQAVSALRFFYGVTLNQPGLVRMIPYGKRPKPLPCVLSRDEVRLLLDAASPGWFGTFARLSYACGLRVSEAVALRVADIDSARMAIHLRCAKGKKDRLVPLSPPLLGLLRDDWKQRRPRGWLFPGQRAGRPVNIGSVQRLFHQLVRATGIAKKASLHTLRHSYATHLLEAGCDLPTLQKLLGHSQLSTTLRYTHVERSHLQRAGCPLDTLLALGAGGEKACPRHDWTSGPSSGQPPRAAGTAG
jgi:site-specific recombinase XerD